MFAVMLTAVGTWAQTVLNSENTSLSQEWKSDLTPWGDTDLTEYPASLSVPDDGTTVRCAETQVTVSAGVLTVLFQYTSGNCRLNMLGVDAIAENGTVVCSDYHVGYTGGQKENNSYSLCFSSTGTYTLRYFVTNDHSGGRLDDTNGNITVTWKSTDDFFSGLLNDAEKIYNDAVSYSGYLGGYTEVSLLSLKNAIDEAKAVISATANDVDALQAAIAALEVDTKIKSNRVYKIRSAMPAFYEKQGEYKAIYNNEGRLAWATENLDSEKFYWKITPADEDQDDIFEIQSCYDEKYMNGASLNESATYYAFHSLGSMQFKIEGGAVLHTEGHSEGAGKGGNIVSWNAGANTGSAWYIVDETYAYELMLARKELDQAIADAKKQLTYDDVPVTLTESMITCNEPEESEGSIGGLIDDHADTYFHTNWHGDDAQVHYIQIDLSDDTVEEFFFNTTNRSGCANDWPRTYDIEGSNDGTVFTDIAVVNSTASGSGQKFESQTIGDMGQKYRYLRFNVTDCYPSYRKYWHLAELSITKKVPLETISNATWIDAINEARAADTPEATVEEVRAAAQKLASTTAKVTAATLLEEYASQHAEKPEIGQYPTSAYNAVKTALESDASVEEINNAVAAFYESKNYPIFTIDGVINYAAGKSIYATEQNSTSNATLFFKTTNKWNRSMLWRLGITSASVTVAESVDIYNYGTNGNFWGSETIKITETSDANAEDGIFLFFTTGNETPVHAQNTNQVIVRWDAYESTSGSAWKFEYVTDTYTMSQITDDKADAMFNLTGKMAELNAILGSGYGQISADNVVALAAQNAAQELLDKTYEELVSVDVSTITSAISTIDAAMATEAYNLPQDGSYLRIRAVKEHNASQPYLSSVNSTSNAQRTAFVKDADASTVFYYKDGKLLAVNTANYIANNSNFAGYSDANAGTAISFQRAHNGMKSAYNIVFAGKNNANRYLYTNPGLYTDAGSSPSGGNGYNFNLVALTDAEVQTLPAYTLTVGDAGYATLYLDYAAEIPENVKAYAATIVNGGYVALTEYQGVVPANAGVIVKAETSGEYKFGTPSKGWIQIEGTNLLEGSIADTYVEGPAYVLSKVGDVVGMYKAKLNKDEAGADGSTHFLNNANKAYLPATAGSEARFLVFNFGDDNATGIDELKGENGNVKAEIYDLSGRRVQKAQKGLYIVNGKKVIK